MFKTENYVQVYVFRVSTCLLIR